MPGVRRSIGANATTLDIYLTSVPGRITSMVVSPNGKFLATRGSDHTLKIWKAKKPTQPLCVISGLPNLNETTNVIFSPDSKIAFCAL